MSWKYPCRSRRHRWPWREEAKRCCNGWTLVYVPMDDYETSGTVRLRLVPDSDVESIERYARYVPLEDASSTPLVRWSKWSQ